MRSHARPTVIAILALFGHVLITASVHALPAELEGLRDEIIDLHIEQEWSEAGERLRGVIEGFPNDVEARRLAYLLLVETWVVRANSEAEFDLQELQYQKARELVVECLSVRDLRGTVPDYPETPTLVERFFQDARKELFGDLTLSISPPETRVQLTSADGEVFQSRTVDGQVLLRNLPWGEYAATFTSEGHNDLEEVLVIPAGASVNREVSLSKKKGFLWYAIRGTAIAGVATGLALIPLGGGSDEPMELLPLEGPPAPPSP